MFLSTDNGKISFLLFLLHFKNKNLNICDITLIEYEEHFFLIHFSILDQFNI